MGGPETTNPAEPSEADLAKSPRLQAWREHNDGHRSSTAGSRRSSESAPGTPVTEKSQAQGELKVGTGADKAPKIFSAQSYLRYQGDKVGSLHEVQMKHR